jgi:Ca2+-binding RTX toxin-like protein
MADDTDQGTDEEVTPIPAPLPLVEAGPFPIIGPLPPVEGEPPPEASATPLNLQEGDEGDNLLVGSNLSDRLLGKGGDDTLVGHIGFDYLDGGGGDDRLMGDYSDPDIGPGTASDLFVFGRLDGHDTILDFDPRCPVCDVELWRYDQISLLDGSQEDITAVIAAATATQDGDAVLHYGETTVTLVGVSPDALSPEMFMLG